MFQPTWMLRLLLFSVGKNTVVGKWLSEKALCRNINVGIWLWENGCRIFILSENIMCRKVDVGKFPTLKDRFPVT